MTPSKQKPETHLREDEDFRDADKTVLTTGTPSDKTGSEGEDYEEIISAHSSSRVRPSRNFYSGHYTTERCHFHLLKTVN